MTEPALDLSALRNAIAPLEGALQVIDDHAWFDRQSQIIQDTLMAGAIQNFEFVYELSIKMLRRQRERESDTPGAIDQTGFRDMLRMAGEAGLVANVENWFLHRKIRNITAHTYDREKAQQVHQGALAFITDARSLLASLKARSG